MNVLRRYGTPKVVRRSNQANDADRHVGNRIRERRIALGFSQQKLADRIGVTYQQVNKYEKCTNRITADRLIDVAKVLGVPVSYFFQGLETRHYPSLTVQQQKCLELARNFALITDPRQQEALSQMARALASEPKMPWS